jgi:hypothetical protein
MSVNANHVFISHIHQEAALGTVAKAIIEEVFSRDGVSAFLSSDMRDIPAGRKWLDEISEQLEQCRVVVSLLSPTSLTRPWVNIELGAGWIKGLRVIPLCHSGLLVGDLPRPFGDFNGVGLDQNDAAERLLLGVADGLRLAHPGKWLNFDGMLKSMRAAVPEIKVSKASNSPAPSAALGRDDLEPEQVCILQVLARALNQGRKDVLLADLPSAANIKPAALTHHIAHLHKWQFVYVDRYASGDDEVRLLPNGSKWLMDRNAMPD